MKRRSTLALAGAAAGLAAGVVAERVAVRQKRATDPERHEDFGARRGIRARRVSLDDGTRIFVEEVGPEARRGAVFVHGSALRTDMWHYQMTGLGNHRLVFFDMRGHGTSPRGDADFSIKTLADDLGVVIDDCGLDEVVIVGHSVGGMIAVTLCLEHPDLMGSKIKGLGLLNTTYGPAFETFIGGAAVARFERFLRRPLDVIGSRSAQIDRLRKLVRPSDALFWGVAFAGFGPKPSAKQVDFVYDMLSETSSDVIFDLVKSYRAFDARDRLEEVTVPALIVAGRHDRLTLPGASEYLDEHLPKSELHVLDAGHMSMLERHDEVNAMLTGFFDDTLGKAERKSS